LERRYFARDGQRYIQVTPGARYEHEIQRLVEKNLTALFPEYRGILFDPLLETPIGNVQPDLVLVRDDGSGWALVEVELQGHSFATHVLPQLGKLARAESNRKVAETLIARLPELPAQRIRTALTFNPEVYLVIHGTSRNHHGMLTKLGVEVRDIDVLEAPDRPNDYILIVNDPTIRRREIGAHAIRSVSPVTRSIWRIADPDLASLVTDDKKIEVEVLATRAFWSVTMEQDGILLRQPGGLSDPTSDVDSIVRAKVLVDDEHRVLYLEPAGGSS